MSATDLKKPTADAYAELDYFTLLTFVDFDRIICPLSQRVVCTDLGFNLLEKASFSIPAPFPALQISPCIRHFCLLQNVSPTHSYI